MVRVEPGTGLRSESVSYQQGYFQEGNRFGTCMGWRGPRWKPERRGLVGVKRERERLSVMREELKGSGDGALGPGWKKKTARAEGWGLGEGLERDRFVEL